MNLYKLIIPIAHGSSCVCAPLCLTLCRPMGCSPPGSSVHGILQARILEWVAISSSGDLPEAGIEPVSLVSPALQVDSLPLAPPRKPHSWMTSTQIKEHPARVDKNVLLHSTGNYIQHPGINQNGKEHKKDCVCVCVCVKVKVKLLSPVQLFATP